MSNTRTRTGADAVAFLLKCPFPYNGRLGVNEGHMLTHLKRLGFVMIQPGKDGEKFCILTPYGADTMQVTNWQQTVETLLLDYKRNLKRQRTGRQVNANEVIEAAQEQMEHLRINYQEPVFNADDPAQPVLRKLGYIYRDNKKVDCEPEKADGYHLTAKGYDLFENRKWRGVIEREVKELVQNRSRSRPPKIAAKKAPVASPVASEGRSQVLSQVKPPLLSEVMIAAKQAGARSLSIEGITVSF